MDLLQKSRKEVNEKPVICNTIKVVSVFNYAQG